MRAPSIHCWSIPRRCAEFVRLPFDAPLYIMFSSGTTGVPKCIVHGIGGTLLQHRKEQLLHCDLRSEQRLLFFTTCGWMMWNWLDQRAGWRRNGVFVRRIAVSSRSGVLLRYVEEETVDHFGISPGFLSNARKESLRPARAHRLTV